MSGGVCEDSFCNYTSTPRIMFKCPAINERGEDLIHSSFLGSKIDLGHQTQIIWACPINFRFAQWLFITEFCFWHESKRFRSGPKFFWTPQKTASALNWKISGIEITKGTYERYKNVDKIFFGKNTHTMFSNCKTGQNMSSSRLNEPDCWFIMYVVLLWVLLGALFWFFFKLN